MSLSVTKFSPAKINLYLEVKKKRHDGYHDIESLMTFCNYGDLVSVKRSEKFNFRVEGPCSNLLKNKENLIEKAKEKLENFYERKLEVDVILKKNLPVSSGMAGGSSNAATFIRCIKEIFGLKELEGFNHLLLSLGADVPFCYYGRTALVTGIGEKIKFVDNIKEYYVLLINPRIEVSTKEIFDNLIISRQEEKKCKNSLNQSKISFFIKKKNDLESQAIKKNSLIKEILEIMSSYKGSLLSRMTGSGATCYALFDSLDDLEIAKTKAKKKFCNYWIKGSRLTNSLQDI